MKKKLLALICALALVFSLVGCTISAPDTVGSIGDFEITSGMYLLAQYGAYQQAAQLAGTDQDTTDVKAFLKETITTDSDSGETAVVSDYVAQKTQETLETLAAVDARFKALGGELTDEQIATADRYAQQMMDQYGDTYTANGIGLETLKAFERIQLKHTLLLTLVYGPDGESPVDDSDLTAEDYNAEGLLNYPVLADVGSIAINAGTSADGLKAAKSAALWLYSNGAGEDALTETLGVVTPWNTAAGTTAVTAMQVQQVGTGILPGVALDTAAAEALTANELTLQDSEKHTKAERTAFVDGALAALGAE
mgnify:CR=1 FL=1